MDDDGLVTQVAVRDLPVMADIGIHPHEIGRRQTLIVSVLLSIDAVAEDSIAATIDYRRIVEAAEALAAQRIALIETFGRRLALRCLAFPGVRLVVVTIDKPQALLAGMASVSITLEREAGIQTRLCATADETHAITGAM